MQLIPEFGAATTNVLSPRCFNLDLGTPQSKWSADQDTIGEVYNWGKFTT